MKFYKPYNGECQHTVIQDYVRLQCTAKAINFIECNALTEAGSDQKYALALCSHCYYQVYDKFIDRILTYEEFLVYWIMNS